MTALELAALAGISRAMETSAPQVGLRRHPEPVEGPLSAVEAPLSPSVPDDEEVLAEIASPEDEVIVESPHAILRKAQDDTVATQGDTVAPQHEERSDALEFLRGADDAQARFYRASDEQIQLLVAFLSDGRVRLIDADGRRFAGMLETEKADLIEISSNEWSRVFVSATPDGRTQLELQGGPHDTHVLICEALPE